MSDELTFVISLGDFDTSLLQADAQTPGTDAFQQAVSRFFEKEYVDFGGWVQIAVDTKTIKVTWRPDPSKPEPLDIAVSALTSGDYKKGVRLLELIRQQNPDDIDVLYNLGMALSDMNQLETALRYLQHAADLAPDHVNALVAIGVALARQGKSKEAIPVLERAVRLDPTNPWAQRNLGGCLFKMGDSANAEKFLSKAVELNPRDQQALYGLAEALMANDNDEEADPLYVRIIELDSRSPIADLARDARSKLSQKSFRSNAVGDLRPDAVMYLLGALQKFGKMKKEQIQQISFEIAILGQRGLNPNISEQKYQLRSLPGKFSALHLLCLMFVGFRMIAPEHSIGFDLAKEFEAAESMYKAEGGKGP